MMSKEIVAAVNQTIETLPDELKEAIKFREMEGLSYEEISDFMSGCFVFKKNTCISYLKKIDVNGFKFLYELLSVSNGIFDSAANAASKTMQPLS